MRCRVCKTEKLSKEFPREPVSDSCQHPPLYCLRCVTSKVSSTGCCPYNGCGQQVSKNCQKMQEFKAQIAHLFPEPSEAADSFDLPLPSGSLPTSTKTFEFSVVTMTGENVMFQLANNTSIFNLKQKIFQRLKIQADKQRLVYKERDLETYSPSGTMTTLKDYGVEPFSTIHLLVLLYSIPEAFDHVIFDLFWGYPPSGCDYLDASCLAFSGSTFHSLTDYTTRNTFGIVHSGDVMNDQTRQGHHTIDVKLKQVPAQVTHLVFTLSAYNSPTIAYFPNPSLRFVEATNKTKDLCKTTFTQARNSEAVIMCSVSRKQGTWQIFESGVLSAGNATDYSPLQNTIRNLVVQGLI